MVEKHSPDNEEGSSTRRDDAALPAEGSTECVVVGIGASAGGLEAYKRLLGDMPRDTGMAFVLVQHLDPTHQSLMVELLAKHTRMPISEIEDATPIRPNHVYMIPPNHFVTISGDHLFLEAPTITRGVRLPIDHFFTSLAERGERAVCIVLSGTGSDGAAGIREVKAGGGMTLAQDAEDAEYDGMPRAAAATGAVDYVVPIAGMAELLVPYARHPYVRNRVRQTIAESAPGDFRSIVRLLQAHTDQDFSLYKTGTLTRRIERRMGIRQVGDTTEYLALLRSDHDEVQALFKDLLIGVTRFFRDADAWDVLAENLGNAMQQKVRRTPLRIWVPGCSTGEEAYSIAALAFELQERVDFAGDIQIFGTDVESSSIDLARQGEYAEGAARDIPDRLDRWFRRENGVLRVHKRLREVCVFAVHSILSDPPFSNLDLVSCRNLLIYLETASQQTVLDTFHFALRPQGLLFLGSSESPGRRRNAFRAVSQSARIYRKEGATHREGAHPLGGYPPPGGQRAATPVRRPEMGTVELARRALLDEFAPASVVVDRQGLIRYFHGPLRNYLDFPVGDADLDIGAMALSGLKSKVRSTLQAAWTEDDAVVAVAPRVRRNGGVVSVQLRAWRLPGSGARAELCALSFTDASAERQLTAEVADGQATDAGSDESDLMLELQATREDLQSTIEELESSNEELKASNEEVMSMNEELQSTNEELETSREELQSLNEELSTVNSQLQDKVAELEATNDDLSNLLTSTEMATLFLDQDLRIRRFTPATERLLNLIGGDVGRPLSDLAPRVDDPYLVRDAGKVLSDLIPAEAEVRNGGGNTYFRRITPFRTSENRIAGVVVTFADITLVKQASEMLEIRERQGAEVARLGRIALAGEPLGSLFNLAVRVVAERLNVDYAKILQLKPDGQALALAAGIGWRAGLVGKAEVPAGVDSQAGYTLQQRGPVISLDLAAEKRFRGPQLLIDHQVVSGLSVPIGPEGDPWGVFGAHSRRPVEFSIDDTNFVLAVANVLWQAIRRDAVEEELRISEARTTAFLSNSAVVAWMKDSDGRYIYVTDNLVRHFRVERERWIGHTDRDLWPAETAEALIANDERAAAGTRSVEMLEHVVGPDGVDEHWIVSKFPFTSSSGQRFVGGVGVDVSERVRAQEAMTRSEQRLQSLIDSTTVGIAFVTHAGQVLRANDALLRMLRLPREGLQPGGWSLGEDGPLPFDPEFAQDMDELRSSVASGPTEIYRLDAQGNPLWLLASAVQADPEDREYVAFLVDITRQKQAESALAESEERLRLAARLAGFGAYYGDLRSGEFYWSDELVRIFGSNGEIAQPTGLDELPGRVHEDDAQRVRESLQRSVDPDGDGEVREEYRVVRPDGEVRWILMRGRTIFRREGEIRRASRVAGVALDITQRHRFEEELWAARQMADAANEAKSQFLANMSHEIRTPMTAILGFAEVLEARLDDDDARACVQTIRENGKHLCELLDDILDLEKVESGKRQPHIDQVDVLGLLADVRSLMSVPAQDAELGLSLRIDGRVPGYVRTDGRFVRQVLLNLVGNALKFTAEGGVKIVARCDAEQEMLEIEVEDTGIGIAEEDGERLFQPFEQADSSLTKAIGGSGLGLAISRELIAMLGGDLTFDSVVGEGTTFSFRVPTGPLDGVDWYDAEALALDEPAAAIPEELPPIRGRILLVDDRRDIRYLVREFLEAAGADVQQAGNGEEALRAVEEAAGQPPDAIIMDIQMPVMDGLEATRRLRDGGYGGPILALTATVGQRDLERCLAAGCDGVVVKPINRSDLLLRLDRALRGEAQVAALRVLLVDDHADTNAALEMLLTQRGYRVATAEDGESALAAVTAAVPDVVLLDLGMPGMSGEELLGRLRQRPELDRCVFVGASGRQLEPEDWRGLGFDHFLVKPLDLEQVDRLLGGLRATV